MSASKRRFNAGGCLLRVAVAMAVLTGIVVAIGTFFNEGDNADQPLHGFVAGTAAALPPGSVNYFEQEHIFLTHLPAGEFVALYDRSPRQQELNGDCRIRYEETAGIGTLAPIAGTTGAFVEECNNARAVWRVGDASVFVAARMRALRSGFIIATAGLLCRLRPRRRAPREAPRTHDVYEA